MYYIQEKIMDKLYIIIPAYNEEMNIAAVAKEWHTIAVAVNAESRVVIIDDGSKDGTYSVIQKLQIELFQLIVITKSNSGHGATVLYGYQYALDNGADFIFQTDSDGQTLASEFWQFWEKRGQFSALIGYRHRRQDGLSRIFVTTVLKGVLRCIFGVSIPDANTPYRLMQRDTLQRYIVKIPENFNLSNVLLTIYLVKFKENIKFIPITFKPRQGGVNSINCRRIFKIGLKAIRDFYHIRGELKKNQIGAGR
jgi:glycosyltransferase involved in cell wall biosynthesis